MNYNLKFLKSENQLNKMIKQQKKEGSHIKILFTSLWDEWSSALVKKLKENNSSKGILLYVVDSFSTPHSFVIYKTKKAPCLVTLGKRPNGIIVDDYLPSIYDSFGI